VYGEAEQALSGVSEERVGEDSRGEEFEQLAVARQPPHARPELIRPDPSHEMPTVPT